MSGQPIIRARIFQRENEVNDVHSTVERGGLAATKWSRNQKLGAYSLT
jgi:hypothetical protein